MGFAANEAVFARHEMCFALGENEVVRGIFGHEWHEKEIWPRITRINTDYSAEAEWGLHTALQRAWIGWTPLHKRQGH